MSASKGIYYNPSNVGLATVLKSEAPTLFEIMDDIQAKKAEDEKVKREEAQKRGEQIMKVMEYNPTAIDLPYVKKQQELYEREYIGYAKQIYSNGRIPTSDELIELQRRKNGIEAKTNQANKFRDARTDLVEQVNKDSKLYNKGYIQEYLGGVHFDEKGQLIDFDNLDEGLITRVLSDDKAYNESEISKRFMDKVAKDKKADIISNGSTRIEHTLETQTGIVYELDKNGSPKVDNNGNYIFKITDELFKKGMEDPLIEMMVNKRINQVSADNGVELTPKDAFRQVIYPNVKFDEKKNMENNPRPLQSDSGEKKPHLQLFLEGIDQLLNGYTEEVQTVGGTYDYYLGNDGVVNTNGDGRILMPVQSVFDNMEIGYDGENKKKITVKQVLKDPKGDAYIIDSNENIIPLNSQNTLSFIENIGASNNQNYADYAYENGYVGSGNIFTTRLDKKPHEQKIENSKNKQIQLEETIKKVRALSNETVDKLEEAAKETKIYGYTEEGITSVNSVFAQIPKGTVLDIKVGKINKSYSNPKIEIRDTSPALLPSTKGFFHIFVNGEDTGIEANKDNIDMILKSVKPSQVIGESETKPQPKPKAQPNTSKLNDKNNPLNQ